MELGFLLAIYVCGASAGIEGGQTCHVGVYGHHKDAIACVIAGEEARIDLEAAGAQVKQLACRVPNPSDPEYAKIIRGKSF